MTSHYDEIINKTIDYVKETLKNAESGHDWWHIYRVLKTSRRIATEEKADLFVVELAALLHDIADPKFNDGDELIAPLVIIEFLTSQGVHRTVINHVVEIVNNMSFKNSFDKKKFDSIELRVVQDADRLDALGAIGIARAFIYSGYKGNPIYDPAISPNQKQSKEEYKKGSSTTINHFYEKLFLLKDMMNTQTGKKLAEERHNFMEQFLEQFHKEWRGE